MIRASYHGLRYRWFAYRDGRLDRRYGLSTAGRDDDLHLLGAGQDLPHAYGYEPIQLDVFARILGYLPEDRERFRFVDIGAGKGRAVILAALAGFASCVGVEFARALCDAARDNVERVRPRLDPGTEVEIVLADASDYRFSPGSLVVFLYNPFDDVVMSRVLDNLAATDFRPGDRCLVVYRNPLHARLLDSVEWLELTSQEDAFRVYRRIPH